MTRTLAMHGGKPVVRTPIKMRNSVSPEAVVAANEFMILAQDGKVTLSGYLAGSERGGGAVQRLEDIWCNTFDVKYAVACNSGTSAIMAACYGIGIQRHRRFLVPAMGMSAIAAIPKLMGATVRFVDVDSSFCLDPDRLPDNLNANDTVIAVNLFGRPAQLGAIQLRCNNSGATLIEDACQSLWSPYVRQLSHAKCHSFNVHKPLNAGEGGMLLTDDPMIVNRARRLVNHGEAEENVSVVGLNMRMPELTAIIAMAQINNSKRIVERCRQIAKAIIKSSGDPIISDHYCLPIIAPTTAARDFMVRALNAEGVPCRAGYVLIHKLRAFDYEAVSSGTLPHSEDLNSRLVLIELASIDPTDEQVQQMAQAIEAVRQEIW